MHRTLLAAACCLALAAPAAAQFRRHPDGAAPEGAPAEGGPRERLFISPGGEPFRGEGGLARWFAGADADHDGVVTPAEFRADMVRWFKVLDANGDGRIDGFEIQAYERDIAPEIANMGMERMEGFPGGFRGGGMGRRGGHGGGGPPAGGASGDGRGGPPGGGRDGAARYALLNIPQPVANADEDVDGKVSLAEWMHAADRRFARLDKDKSGRLTLEKLRPPPPDKKDRKAP